MGLDISSFAGLSPAPDAELDEDGFPLEEDKFMYLDPELIKWTEENFPGRTAGIKPGIYSFERSAQFRAGSYSGYNGWRDHLARMAVGMSAEKIWASGWNGPFVELINFPDNEGVIGPVVAAKLAKDFAEFEHRAEEYSASIPDGTDWLENYREWKCAFEMAAKDGAVVLH